MLIIFTFLWLVSTVAEVRNQEEAAVPQILKKPKIGRMLGADEDSSQATASSRPPIKAQIVATTARSAAKRTTTPSTARHTSSASPDWLIFGYNAYTIIIAIAALIIVFLICVIVVLLFRRRAKTAPNTADPAVDGNYAGGGVEDDGGGGGYPPPGAKGPFKAFRFQGSGKLQKSYPPRPGKFPQAPFGTGESQTGYEEGGGQAYDQDVAGESGYGNEEAAAYQEQYPPPQGYGRGFKTRAPFRGGRTGGGGPWSKYPPPQQPTSTKRKKAPYPTLKQGGGPGRFPRSPVKRGFFGLGRGGRGYGAPGQY